MTYQQTVEYLYQCAPLFQNVGQGAYKEGLENTHLLDEHFGHPHQYFKTIHIAGTNGKGSCSHILASILQEAGYKVGLYTSPHLLDFRERIRVNGEMVSERYVVDFVEKERSFFEHLHPSFFELTTALAFKFFQEQRVDVAVVEVGLGGRLDCTNIINPELCIITNISYDHVALLGNTLAKIASEKAGIIKSGIPVVVGEHTKTTKAVFQSKAEETGAPYVFAQDHKLIFRSQILHNGNILFNTLLYPKIECALGGLYQKKNVNTILNALPIVQENFPKITENAVKNGFLKVKENTGLMGRWQTIGQKPQICCDTGHNIGGFKYLSRQLKMQKCNNLRIVIGMVNDKDIDGVLSLLPTDAVYYFCQASVARALPHNEFKKKANAHGLKGHSYPTVSDAFESARSDSSADDFIFVGGSTFVVADFLRYMQSH